MQIEYKPKKHQKIRFFQKYFQKPIDKPFSLWYNIIRCWNGLSDQRSSWEHSSAGRASALQAEGHRFEPCCSHHNGPVVQLVRTLACHARGRRFEPVPGRHFSVNCSICLCSSVGRAVDWKSTCRWFDSGRRHQKICGCSSSGRAPPCQGGGSEFEPRHPLHMVP